MLRIVSLVVALGLLLTLTFVCAGEEPAKAEKPQLPAHLTDVVTESQKHQIRGIQEQYAKRIDELQTQIDALTKQRDTEIDGLLNAAQKAKVKKAREEATKKAADEKKVAEEPKAKSMKSVRSLGRFSTGPQ
jgi:hypothetical protein